MKKIVLYIVLIWMLAASLISQETAFDILDRIDKNMVFETMYSESDMIVNIKKRTITKSMVSYAKGNEKSYIEFLSPARDKGSKILKLDDIVKVYYPSAERVMRLSGHMLRRSMMGSDFSYEDMTRRAEKLRDEYTGEVKADETLDGRVCYVLQLTAKNKKKTYYTRKIWVDKERSVGVKQELFARSGKLLKLLTCDEVKTYKGRYYPTRYTMVDKLRKNSSTIMVIKKLEFDAEIPEGMFTERQLLKK
ncbi:MAG: outer membrane lipoprotein-sorting protein [bacterium]|nr:outer membrane lipoprotein-sorting protein [bacterium]